MNIPRHDSLHLRFVCPIEALDAIAQEPVQWTAIVIVIGTLADFVRHLLASGLASRLVRSGAKLFALVGEESEQAHDALDSVLEREGVEDVVTSWHDEEDIEEVENFVATSSRANGLVRILVVANEPTGYGIRLRDRIVEAINFDRP